MNLIAADGLSVLGLVRIAERVGVVSSALYCPVRGKDEVRDPVLELPRSRLACRVDPGHKEIPRPLQRLESLRGHQVCMWEQNRAVPLMAFADAFCSGDAGRSEQVVGMMTVYPGAIEGIIAEGQRRGGDPPGDCSCHSAHHVWGDGPAHRRSATRDWELF